MDQPTCLIDGFGPVPILRPTSVADLGIEVSRAAASGSALYPMGGQTTLNLGNAPTKPGAAVDLRGLDQVIDFPARDMTVTVQAGITIAKLQALLAPENLRLPIDVPLPDRATLGGILATNVSGPRRLGYGTLRDYVIGISAMNDEGREFKAGGRVVKNVAGYDVCKLLVGSLGTLGIITQATLKLKPLPEQTACIMLGCDAAQIETLLDLMHRSRTRPVWLELLNQQAARAICGQAQTSCPDEAWVIVIGYDGNADAVDWQVQQLVKELGGHSLDARIGASAKPLGSALTEWIETAAPPFSLKANVLPHAVAAFVLAVERDEPRLHIQVHAGNGIALGHSNADLSLEQARTWTSAWRQAAAAAGGNVVVTRCLPEWKSSLNVWGPSPDSAWLMRDVKRQFDPRGIFNPGRFVDRI